MDNKDNDLEKQLRAAIALELIRAQLAEKGIKLGKNEAAPPKYDLDKPAVSAPLRPPPPKDMDNFYVYGCPVMVMKKEFARVNAPNKEAADRVMQYLRDEGFIEEPKDEGETWK